MRGKFTKMSTLASQEHSETIKQVELEHYGLESFMAVRYFWPDSLTTRNRLPLATHWDENNCGSYFIEIWDCKQWIHMFVWPLFVAFLWFLKQRTWINCLVVCCISWKWHKPPLWIKYSQLKEWFLLASPAHSDFFAQSIIKHKLYC